MNHMSAIFRCNRSRCGNRGCTLIVEKCPDYDDEGNFIGNELPDRCPFESADSRPSWVELKE